MPSPVRHPAAPPHLQRGAALLAAMLTVVLVATFAAAAVWQQWRSAEIERAERARVQAAWILVGALDWSRLILSEDARAGGADHLAEPWAVPLQEARLSTFLAAENNVANADAALDAQDAFLSGQIVDLQGRLNVYNLSQSGEEAMADLLTFTRLFEQLSLPVAELGALASQLRKARDNESEDGPLLPQRVEQLTWLGLSPDTVARIAPYVTVLPAPTPLNLNTASSEVLTAAVPQIGVSGAQKLVAARQANPLRNMPEVDKLLGLQAPLDTARFAIASSYFEVRGRLRIDQTLVQERSLVRRQGTQVTTLWRERSSVPPVDAPSGAAQ